MRLHYFVTASSVILLGWLAATFVHQVPSQRYPKLDKYPTTTMRPPAVAAPAAIVAEESAAFAVSVSH